MKPGENIPMYELEYTKNGKHVIQSYFSRGHALNRIKILTCCNIFPEVRKTTLWNVHVRLNPDLQKS